MYRARTGKGDLQQTGDTDATAASATLALHLTEYLHPTPGPEASIDALLAEDGEPIEFTIIIPEREALTEG